MKFFLKSIKEGMYFFAELISNFVNTVLLLFAYFFVLGPTAIIAKIVGKRFLQTKNDSWTSVDNKREIKNSLFRQF